MSVQPGELLLHYQIERKLGEGGMGEVWLAQDTRLGRKVALKFLARRAALDPEARERLAREARAASALNHPNILTIYAVESDGERTFIAMEYADGQPLDEWIAGRTPELSEVLELALQIGDGLAAAHDKGIVHRDIKPANVMISTHARVQVMDFGLAKVSSEPQLTQTGSTLGTLAYMSPEQVKGQEVDARSDVFSFGAMLYELVCGRSPFQRDAGPAAVLNAILNEDPKPASRLRAGLPRDLDRILARALEKDRDRRYPDLTQLLADLRALIEQRPIARAAPGRWRRWAGVVALLLGLYAGVWWFDWREQASQQPATGSPAPPSGLAGEARGDDAPDGRGPSGAERPDTGPDSTDPGASAGASAPPTAIPAPRFNQRLVSLLGGSPHAGCLSPDGTQIAFVNRSGGAEQLFVTGLEKGEPRRLTSGTRDAQRPRWQPDGNLILYQHTPDGENWADGEVMLVSALGGEPRRLLENARQASWSHDGERIVFERDAGIWIADADGSSLRRLDQLPPTTNAIVGQMPALSPDGEQLVFFCSELGPMGRLFIADLDGSNLRPISDGPEIARDPSFTPDGRWVVHSSDRGGPRLLWRASTAEGGPYPPQPITSGTGADSEPCLSADGTRILFTNARKEFVLQSWDPGSPAAAPRVLRASRGVLLFPSWSPDATRIAAFGEGRRGGSQLLVLDADGSNLDQLTENVDETDIFPCWSADGAYLYYFHQLGADSSLRRLELAGGSSQQVAKGWGMQTHPFPSLSPDGRFMLAADFSDRRQPRFVRLDLETGEESDFPVPAFRSSYSETGDRILAEWPPGTMVLIESETRRRTQLGPGQVPRFAGDGEHILFLMAEGEVWQLWQADSSGGERRKLLDLGRAYEQSPWYDVSRYGEVVWSEFRSSPRELWLLDEQ